jgi:small subunit ribosomal protein S21
MDADFPGCPCRATGAYPSVRALTPTHSASVQATNRRMLFVQVLVRDNNVDQALKALKKKMQREGIFREMKLRRHYEKPSERRAREAAEAVRRARKLERKRLEREGF